MDPSDRVGRRVCSGRSTPTRSSATAPVACRFFPTCSCYAEEAITERTVLCVVDFSLCVVSPAAGRSALRLRPGSPGVLQPSSRRMTPVFSGPAWLLAQFYSFTHSYAAAIALITLVVMAFITPLTLKSTKGMLEMQRLQPEMRKLQQLYKNDRQKLNEEMMRLYQEHKVNPLASCLPLAAQMPVFFIMYRRAARALEPSRGRSRPGDQGARAIDPAGSFAPKYVGKYDRALPIARRQVRDEVDRARPVEDPQADDDRELRQGADLRPVRVAPRDPLLGSNSVRSPAGR